MARNLTPRIAGAALALLTILGQSCLAAQGDVSRGEVVAAQGSQKGAPACAQCHAFNGGSDASGAFPRVAGQSALYLSKQLRDYSSGTRSNSLMSQISRALSPQEIDDVAAYYAQEKATPFIPLRSGDPALLKRGEQLATVGDNSRQLQSCNNCHGPGGSGEAPAIPYLAGQYSQYIVFTLKEWKHGFRKSSAEAMGVVAQKMSDQDIAAVAVYFQQVRNAAPATGSTTTAAQPAPAQPVKRKQ